MFKINSEGELLQLLKIVSEEAVKKSKRTLSEAVDTAQERYMSNIRASENKYGVDLSEQEEDAEPEKEVSTQDTEKPDANTPEPEQTAPEQEPSQVDSQTLGVSFDSVIKDINTLRAGRSTKDKEIKDQLLGYYDRLDDDERKILHLFLSEISKILQGALEASDAQDPSEPPFNAEITFGEDDDESGSTPATPAASDSEASTNDVEDTSAPIKVNERQDLREIRKRVKRLMKRF